MVSDKIFINSLQKKIDSLESKIGALEVALWEQELILEKIFQSKFNYAKGQLFDDYSKEMSKIYKCAISEIDAINNGKNKEGIVYGVPYWRYLAERCD